MTPREEMIVEFIAKVKQIAADIPSTLRQEYERSEKAWHDAVAEFDLYKGHATDVMMAKGYGALSSFEQRVHSSRAHFLATEVDRLGKEFGQAQQAVDDHINGRDTLPSDEELAHRQAPDKNENVSSFSGQQPNTGNPWSGQLR